MRQKIFSFLKIILKTNPPTPSFSLPISDHLFIAGGNVEMLQEQGEQLQGRGREANTLSE